MYVLLEFWQKIMAIPIMNPPSWFMVLGECMFTLLYSIVCTCMTQLRCKVTFNCIWDIAISTHPRFCTCTSGHATKVRVCHGCPWAVSYVLSFECVCVRCIVHTVFYKKIFCRSVGPYTLNSAPTLLMMLIGDTTGLPWLVYQAFVVEEYHSFNKQVSIVMCY